MRSALFVLLSVLMVSAATPTDPREDKKRIDTELAQAGALAEAASAEARQAVARLAELNKALAGAQELAARARGALAAAEVEESSRQRQAARAKEVWQAADVRYEAASARVREGRQRLGHFVAETHMGGDLAKAGALLGSGGPSEFAVRVGYLRKVAEAKRAAIDGLALAQREAKQVANEATLAKRAADESLEAARRAALQAVQAKADAERAEAQAAELVTGQEEAAAKAESYRDEVIAKHEEVKRESERIAAELAAWEQSQNGSNGSSGSSGPVMRPGAKLLMPVAGWKSSDFGNRYDPYFHVWQLHAGVDIAAGGGEPIYAAADGRVASAGWRGGYGNYTCLSHGSHEGRSLSTCYAHQSRILVNVGQSVSRGQLIGRVGTTGASTGNHLHFEVRLDGEPVDPENWLPACLC
jgi:murein DD-endopeptidase MepM/ murein hydrolase activator NlpD